MKTQEQTTGNRKRSNFNLWVTEYLGLLTFFILTQKGSTDEHIYKFFGRICFKQFKSAKLTRFAFKN